MIATNRPHKAVGRGVLAAVAMAAPALLVLSGPAAVAGKPAAVPLNPAPPDYYSCTTNGSGTYCSGESTFSYGPEPLGVVCGSGPDAFEVLDQAVRHTQAERWYDQDGNIVKRQRTNTFETASLSSPSGAQVGYSQRDRDIDVFSVPGDITMGTTYTNSSLRATVPGMGAVIVEKGRLVWGENGDLLQEAGRHDLLDYFLGDPGALDKLCAALGA